MTGDRKFLTGTNRYRAQYAGMDEAPYMAVPPATEPKRVIAALGPKMLELARDSCAGAHPYFSSPAHTAMARKILGPDAMLCVEQKVLVESDAEIARKAARVVAQIYLGLPNYRNNWLRMGLNESDLDNGGSQWQFWRIGLVGIGTTQALRRLKQPMHAGGTKRLVD